MDGSKLQIGLHVEGTGSGLMQGNIPTFTWRDWLRPQAVGIAAEIQMRHLQDEVTPLDLTREGKRRQKTCFNVSLQEQRPEWGVCFVQKDCVNWKMQLSARPLGALSVCFHWR